MNLLKKSYALSIITLFLISFLLPYNFVFAQQVTLESVILKITNLIALVIPIAFALAILFFFWGIAKFIYFADNETKRTEGKNILIWGVIAIFFLVSIWGVVALLQDTFLGGSSFVPCGFLGECAPS